jgi:hypothetical protein
VITVSNSSSQKAIFKSPLKFTIYYSGYKDTYNINLGRIKPGKTETKTGLGDRSPAMNFPPDVYISNVGLPEIIMK